MILDALVPSFQNFSIGHTLEIKWNFNPTQMPFRADFKLSAKKKKGNTMTFKNRIVIPHM